MISVAEALEKLLALAAPLGAEDVALGEAAGRVLARHATARRDQPPFAASVMDGYAVAGPVAPGDVLEVIGESAAGRGAELTIAPGQAVRIFTGAPIPAGADRVVIQEDVSRDGDEITIGQDLEDNKYIRPIGADFRKGDTISAPRVLSAADIALLASMNIPVLKATRRPVIAMIATGDELVMPGEAPGPDQIIASNAFGLKAMAEAAGAEVRLLPIARDTAPALMQAFELARGADLIVTIGGASVGDYDLVAPVAAELGMEQSFYKVRMRPGKPLMAGRLGDAAMIGLPGNPVSAMVCGKIFMLPMIRAMLGLPHVAPDVFRAPLRDDLAANGSREHYMRAILEGGQIRVFDRQDSSLLSVLSAANVLVLRAPGAPAQGAGEMVDYLPL